jgi:2-haloacid dehalogenase
LAVKSVVFDAYGTLYDVQSVSSVIHEIFPDHGDVITQVWRIKQLEYSWLRSLMGRYEDFWNVTKESLNFTLQQLGLDYEPGLFDQVMDKYLNLDPFPDAKATLESIRTARPAILSNGSPEMLKALVDNTGFDSVLDAVISIDSQKIFKPSPKTYELVEAELGVSPAEVLFVSSNAFDACGAKSFGMRVAWIERATPAMVSREVQEADIVGPGTMYKILRLGMETLGFEPDHRISSLSELPAIVRRAT